MSEIESAEFPKWVEPHASHVERQGDHLSVAHFPFHVDRKGVVSVLVADADEEKKALAENGAKPADETEVA